MIPSWILDIFAAIMLAVAAISASRLIAAPPWDHADPDADIDAAHILMGIAMAGMLVSGLTTLPSAGWVAVFAIVTTWFAWRVWREARATRNLASILTTHHVPHLIHGAAMIYMFAALGSPGAMAGSSMAGQGSMGEISSMGALRAPTVALVFVLLMAGWVVADLDQVSKTAARAPMPGREVVLPAGLRHRIAAAAAGTGSVLAGAAPAGGRIVPVTAVAATGPTATAEPDSAEPDSAEPDSAEPASAAQAGQLPQAAHRLLDPRVATTCRIAMGVTMALMLVLMI